MASKTIIRQKIKSLLKEMSSEEKRRQSEAILKKLTAEEWFRRSQRIGVYVSLDREVDTKPIIRTCFELNKHVFVPQYDQQLDSRRMDFLRLYSMQDLETLPKTKWGIKQPKDEDKSWREIGACLDVLLVPGVAFTREGKRLGNGFGFYDQWLLKNSSESLLAVGLAFREQVVSDLEEESHDLRVKRVLIA